MKHFIAKARNSGIGLFACIKLLVALCFSFQADRNTQDFLPCIEHFFSVMLSLATKSVFPFGLFGVMENEIILILPSKLVI